MKLKSIFKGYRAGDSVLGAIMLYRLSVRTLLESGAIVEADGDYLLALAD